MPDGSAYDKLVRRVQRPDLEEMRPEIRRRLAVKYPHVDEAPMFAFLMSCLDSNEFFFIRNAGAVGLGMIDRRPLYPPRVVEKFCLALYGDAAAAVEVTRAIVKWAFGMDMREVVLEQMSDVPREKIKELYGRVLSREERFIRIDP